MKKVMMLNEMPVGELGEIIELPLDHQASIFHEFGAAVGMSVVVLQKAVDALVQIGYTQVVLPMEVLSHIKVRTI